MEASGAHCRQNSRDQGESLVATASADIETWLLIEHREPWEAKAVESAAFPPAVRERLDHWLATLPRCRGQLIRRPQQYDAPRAAYLISTRAPQPAVFRFEFVDAEQWLDIDLPAALDVLRRGETPIFGEAWSLPLVLVCTHGKRDACCAKWGQPVYQAASACDGFDVWQTSHLGGHRFAATVTVLPLGLSYGRVEVEDVPALLEATAKQSIWRLDRFRGRHALSPMAMAAEHFVREHTGDHGPVSFEILDQEPATAATQAVRLQWGARRYRVQLRSTRSSRMILPSCGKTPEPLQSIELVVVKEEE